mmetsp:Transcript_24159/g.27860  ORF Transcript_24159/g.27860 Transcript_24159/m.27860 type:complete len:379 (-) Transcript_24159:596-1732(-)|eukprot:CAMPEP_0168327444 /NCGR_PEP_ID=MMETSP0213-20121227/5900_1 /TAXON_ID=151035 /ORGANISM="Euplotes harpa, Strain FSP1.4" /LENGTH=378 /DNA_ID=CAMNT_0008330347 /DNA_START=566 /DNA_END=1702 /DNA_ORIENTATION=+
MVLKVGNSIRSSRIDYVVSSANLPMISKKLMKKCASDHLPIRTAFGVPEDRYRPYVLESSKILQMRFDEFIELAKDKGWPLKPLSLNTLKERPYKPSLKWDRARANLLLKEREPLKSYKSKVLELWQARDRRPFYNFMNGIMRFNSGLPTTLRWGDQIAWSREASTILARDYWSTLFYHPKIRINFLSENYQSRWVTIHTTKSAKELKSEFEQTILEATRSLSLNKAFGNDGIQDKWLKQYAYAWASIDETTKELTDTGATFSSSAEEMLEQFTEGLTDLSARYILSKHELRVKYWDQIKRVSDTISYHNMVIQGFLEKIFNRQIKIPKYLLEGRLILLDKDKKGIPSPIDTRPIVILSTIRKLIELVWLKKYSETLW